MRHIDTILEYDLFKFTNGNVVSRFICYTTLVLLLIFLSACKLPAQVRKEEAETQRKLRQAEQAELQRQKFCQDIKQLKVGMTDEEMEVIGLLVYPLEYRRQIKCDHKHPNKLQIRLRYVTYQFGDECRIVSWKIRPDTNCE